MGQKSEAIMLELLNVERAFVKCISILTELSYPEQCVWLSWIHVNAFQDQIHLQRFSQFIANTNDQIYEVKFRLAVVHYINI